MGDPFVLMEKAEVGKMKKVRITVMRTARYDDLIEALDEEAGE